MAASKRVKTETQFGECVDDQRFRQCSNRASAPYPRLLLKTNFVGTAPGGQLPRPLQADLYMFSIMCKHGLAWRGEKRPKSGMFVVTAPSTWEGLGGLTPVG